MFDPRDYFDQSGLAGSVLSDQTVDFRIAYPYIHVVQSAKPAVALADVLQLQEILPLGLMGVVRHGI
jgi:hypothetical protein